MEQNVRHNCVAIVPAAGSGTRLQSVTAGSSKLLLRFNTPGGERSLLEIAVANLLKSGLFTRVVIACSQESMAECKKELVALSAEDSLEFVLGGATRQESVRNALGHLIELPVTHVAIHDAARPFVSLQALKEVVTAGIETGAALLVEKVNSTLKRISAANEVLETFPRTEFTLAQTPQVFDFDLILNAHREAKFQGEATDDCQLVEMLGIKPRAVVNSTLNPKITEPADLDLARLLAGR